MRVPLTALIRTPSFRASSTSAGAFWTSASRMLVCGACQAKGTMAASFFALSWSSASRCRWWSSAYIPAAASTPAWRSPPPIRFRSRRTPLIRSRVVATRDPAGAPSPLLRHTDTVSALSHHFCSAIPVATCAFQMRAPSRCTARPAPCATSATVSICASGQMVPPPRLCVFSIATAFWRGSWSVWPERSAAFTASAVKIPRGPSTTRLCTPQSAEMAPPS